MQGTTDLAPTVADNSPGGDAGASCRILGIGARLTGRRLALVLGLEALVAALLAGAVAVVGVQRRAVLRSRSLVRIDPRVGRVHGRALGRRLGADRDGGCAGRARPGSRDVSFDRQETADRSGGPSGSAGRLRHRRTTVHLGGYGHHVRSCAADAYRKCDGGPGNHRVAMVRPIPDARRAARRRPGLVARLHRGVDGAAPIPDHRRHLRSGRAHLRRALRGGRHPRAGRRLAPALSPGTFLRHLPAISHCRLAFRRNDRRQGRAAARRGRRLVALRW